MKTHTHKMHSTITKTDESAEEVMKGYTGKHATRRILFIFPILAILLTVSPIPAQAGVIDTVNKKVTIILNKVKSIASNTNGLKDFTTTVRDIRDSMGSGMISDMQETLGETQDLIQFIKDRRESAGQTSQYPSLHILVESLSNVSNVLTNRDGQGSVLESLSALLAVLPDKALAPVARAFSQAGVDADFVAKIDQTAIDLVEIRDILEEIDARRHDAFQKAFGDDELLFAEFGCHIRDRAQLVRLSRLVRAQKKFWEIVKVTGAIIDATDGAIKIDKGAGIHGYIKVAVKQDAKGATGKLMVVLADGVLVKNDTAQNIIERCENYYKKQDEEAA